MCGAHSREVLHQQKPRLAVEWDSLSISLNSKSLVWCRMADLRETKQALDEVAAALAAKRQQADEEHR